jgi:V/A-type H+-transporting ATPase subunit E
MGKFMDATVKELIDRIKNDGISTAQAEAQKIVDDAKKEAEKIIKNGKKEAAAEMERAKDEVSKFEQSSKDALVQASRDVLLGVKNQIGALAETLIQGAAGDALSGKSMEPILMKVAEAWAKNPAGAEVQVPEADLSALTKALQSKLSSVVKAGVEITAGSRLTKGFRIGEKEGSAFYNFTPDEVAGVLGELVGPKLKEILDQAAKEA